MDNKPIARSKHIIELSKDHHSGLLFCWKIKEGLKKEVVLNRIKKYINFFWEDHLKEHFMEEEYLLFNQLDSILTRQGKEEHNMFTKMIEGFNNYESQNADDYYSFTELMIKHIRFEERILFPHLEKELPEATLINAGKYLALQHQSPFKDDYADEFWLQKKSDV